MIDAIKISGLNWYQQETINNSLNNITPTFTARQDIDRAQVRRQSEEYFYEDEKLRNIKVQEEDFEFKLTDDQAEYFIRQGYEVEELTNQELSQLDRNHTKAGRRQNNLINNQGKTQGFQDKIGRLKEHTDGMYMYAMNSQGSLSINDLYKGSYSLQGTKENTEYTINQINGVLDLNNLEATNGNQWAVSKLLSLGMEVSQNDVIKIQNIKAAVEGLRKEEEAQNAEDRTLIEEEKILYTEKDIQEIIDEITNVDEQVIQDTLLEGKEVTIGNLREVMHRNTEKVLGRTSNIEVEHKTKETKQQLNEIRGKLNTEAAIKISEKMPLESTELSKVVKELRAIEEEEVEAAIERADMPSTNEVKELIKETLRATNQIAYQKDFVVAMEVNEIEEHTLEKLSKTITLYEENSLQPEKRFGETVVKVEEQINQFLEGNNIEATKENHSAAKALITNGIELTVSNIQQATKVIQKVDVFLEEMTPERAAILIKEGINPYKASINQIVEWIGDEKIPKLKNIVAEAIVGLEQRGQINESQKQSLLGLYRILGGVASNKEQVVGYIFKNQLPLTIEKLEEATKYAKKTEHIQVNIDDEFGEIQELKYTKATARQMIEKSYEENSEWVERLIELEHKELLPSSQDWNEIEKIKGMLYPLVKGEVKKELGKFEGGAILSPSILEKLNSVKEVSNEILDTMNRHNIPITLSNLHWMKKLVENPNVYGELLRQEGLSKEIFPKDIESLEEELERLRVEVREKKECLAEKGDILGYRTYKQLEEVTGIQKQLIQKEGLYQIPFMIDGETKMVHLYVNEKENSKKREAEGVKAVITYETRELGTVIAKLQIKEEKLKFSIYGENQAATRKLRNQNRQLEVMLEKIGCLVVGSEYSVEKSDNVIINPEQVAKRGDSYFEVVV